MGRITAIIGSAAILALVVLALLVNHYRDNAIEYKQQRDAVKESLTLANATIDDMQVRQREVATLDEKYTKELADAKKQLEDLQRCVSSGKCELHVNAKCPANVEASTTGLGDASSPRLTDSAERDYFTLRERIETSGKMIAGLQEFIQGRCIKKWL